MFLELVPIITIIILVAVAIILLDTCEQSPIRNLPSVPGYPIFGSLLQLGKSQALTYCKWAKVYGPLFQVRLGCQRVVVANSYNSVRQLWIENMTANCSRPISYTFHKIVSTSQGYTVGTTPWGNDYKRKRKLIGKALNGPSIRSYTPIIGFESAQCIKSMLLMILAADAEGGESYGSGNTDDVSVSRVFDAYALNTGLSINYGTRLDNYLDAGMLKEILTVEKKIGQFRASLDKYQDYIPLLRLVPGFSDTKDAVDCRIRRDRYLNELLCGGNGNKNSIARDIASNPDAQIGDVRSICLTMVSAGLDTVPSTLTHFIGHMSQPYGQHIQQRAYGAIVSSTSWDDCLEGSMIEYIRAIMDETLRFSAMPISLPRKTIKDIVLYDQGVVIPAGTKLILNTVAANFDPTIYHDPFTFDPDRFMNSPKGPRHYAFGAGLRGCAGQALAERELYTAIVRIILAFQILPPNDVSNLMCCDPLVNYREQKSLQVDTPPFKVRLVPRNLARLKSDLGI